jgi:hypothetical protein
LPKFAQCYLSHYSALHFIVAIARAKINNAVVTIDESHETESLIMRKHLIVALLLTIATGLIAGVLVNLGI